MSPKELIESIGKAARRASREMARARTAEKNLALRTIAKLLIEREAEIRCANEKDLEAARAEGLSEAFVDRLTITKAVLERMAEGVIQIADLPDPIGTISEVRPMPSGIEVGRMRVPLGVIAMIYESRPNVTVAATKRLKAIARSPALLPKAFALQVFPQRPFSLFLAPTAHS